MPRRDRYHNCVRHALIKAGWQITHDPLMIYHENTRVYVDLAAEREASTEYIAIEVKVFSSKSRLEDFEQAIGQYELYRMIMNEAGITREFYLALPEIAWLSLQKHPVLLRYLQQHGMLLLIFEPQQEEVTRWIKQGN